MASLSTDIILRDDTATIGDRLLRLMESLARLSPTYRRVEAVSALSDADLAAQGTTRTDAALRIFGSRLYA